MEFNSFNDKKIIEKKIDEIIRKKRERKKNA